MNRFLFHCVIHLGIIAIIAIVIVGKWGFRTTEKIAKPQSKIEAVEPIQVRAPPLPKEPASWAELFKPGKILTPREIADFISKNEGLTLTPLWQQLGVKDGDEAGSFEKCFGTCEVDETHVNTVNEPDQKIILRIKTDWDYRYLIFQENDERTVFLGSIDATYQKYGPPDQRIVTIGEKGTWLVLTTLGASGTGVSLHFDQWYDITYSGARNVMAYPSTGSQSSWGGNEANRAFDSRIVSQTIIEGRYTVEILFSISYTGDPPKGTEREVPLFANKKKVRYVWNPKEREFVLDPDHSQLTERELDSVYTVDDYPESLTNEQFLSYNYRELMRLAVSGKRDQKNWLSGFLDVCKNTREKKRLSAMPVR